MTTCSLHPKYVGKGAPRSTDPDCTCPQVWAEALEARANADSEESPGIDHRVSWPNYKVLEGADVLIEAALARKDPTLHRTRAPAGAALRGASTLNRFNKDGSVTSVLQWVKTKNNDIDPDQLIEIVRGAVLANPIPAASVVRKLQTTSSEYEVAIVIGDAHFGMLAWDKETGDDWDVEIARKVHTSAIREALRLAPASSRLLLINLGDAVHADGNTATTTAGTRVDVDSRWPKVIGIFVETMNLAILEGLTKHDHVELVNIRGNHDDLSAIVIRMILAERWRDNPRVTIADNLKMVWGHKFGVNLICALHGDKTKLNNIPSLIAQDYRKEWGASTHTHVYAGHFHSHKVQEFPGVEVEYMRILGSKDAWHAGQGYRSRRSLRCDVWHHEFGRVMMHEIGIESLQ